MTIRVLHFITTLDRGGAENALLDLLPRLNRDRVRTAIAWLKGPGELAPEFERRGIPTVPLGMRGLWDARVLVGAAALARRLKPDIVHTHLFKADVAGAFAAKSARAGLVSTKHNEDPQLRIPVVRGIAARLARSADAVVAVSDAVGRHVRSRLALHRDHVRTVRYGLDLDEIDAHPDAPDLRAELGMAPGQPLVLFAGRLVPQKALEVLITAVARIREAVPDMRVAVAGRGPLEQKMRDRVRALGLDDTIIFLGFRPDAPRLMRQADLFVLPSRWEGLGLVLLEAMAARCPVVASWVGAIPEVVADRETGRLVPPDDPDALADAMLTLLRDPAERRRMGEAGRRRVRERFALETEVARIEALYGEIAGRLPEKRPRRPARRTRVLLVSRPGTGGAARHVQLLAETLDLDRFDLHAAVSSREDPLFPGLLHEAGASVEVLDMRREIAPLDDLRAFFRLLRLIRKTKPDLLHAHASKAGVLCRLAGALTGIPAVYSPHGYAFGYVGGTMYRWAERALRPFTDGVICVSRAERATARRYRLASRTRVHLVPNAVDPDEFADLPDRAATRARLGIPADALVALMVARLAPPKDPLTFIKAGAFLPLGPQPPRLLLVGDGPLRAACLDFALETDLGDTLVCPGSVNDMPALLSAADVLVLSTGFEGLPYVLLEGLAAGLPVVASDVPGCRDLLAGGRGRLVPPGNAPLLGEAIEAAFSEGRGPSRLPPGYDLTSWITRIEEIYDSVGPSVSRQTRP
jgi:glycosyltransferase involved in cell wall biosynthesis